MEDEDEERVCVDRARKDLLKECERAFFVERFQKLILGPNRLNTTFDLANEGRLRSSLASSPLS